MAQFKNITNRELQKAFDFYLDLLELDGNIIAIQLEATNCRKDKLMPAWGWCTQDSITEYTIEIDRTLSRKNVLTVLAHELTHVKQYVTGALVDPVGRQRVPRWMGKPCGLPYHLQPWEIDARINELVLYNAWSKK